MNIAAVVVNFNAGDYLIECVRSLRAEGIADVVVVDNASSDGSVQALRAGYPDVLMVEPGANRGYGAAANRGVAAAAVRAEAVLVLNPDTVLRPGAVTAMTDVLVRDPAVAVVGPRIEEPDGELYPSARTFPALGDAVGHAFVGLVSPRNRWTRRYRMLDWDHGAARAVDWVSGACLLARRSAFEAIGGFDEAFFMYSEDVDLCWRARRAGWDVVYEPRAGVVHVQGVSTAHAPYRMIVEHHRSLLRFWRRTTVGWRRLLLPVVGAGLAVRVPLSWAHEVLAARRRRSP